MSPKGWEYVFNVMGRWSTVQWDILAIFIPEQLGEFFSYMNSEQFGQLV